MSHLLLSQIKALVSPAGHLFAEAEVLKDPAYFPVADSEVPAGLVAIDWENLAGFLFAHLDSPAVGRDYAAADDAFSFLLFPVS